MSLPSFMHEQLPSFDADGYYTGPDGTITFNFNSVDIKNAPEDPGMAESIALACLVKGSGHC